MAITISGENNNDRILASDGVIDSLSGFNVVGVITATSFTGDLTGDVTGNLTGNVTGNINNSTLLLQTGGTERLRIDSNGRLLVGTTTEGHANADDLTIATTAHTGITLRSATNRNGSVFFSDGTSGADEYRGWIQYTHTSDYLTFGTNGGERLRIDSSGRLGLNQSTPASRLHISEAGSNTITIQLTNATTGHTAGTDGMTMGYSTNSSAGFINVCESGSAFTIKTGGTGVANERLRITSTGSVGIGTISPTALLHLHKASGDTIQKIESSNGAAVLDLRQTNGYGYINYRQDGAETFRVGQIAQFTSYSVYNPNNSLPYQFCVEGNGEVGINTGNPANTLHLLRNNANHGITLQRGGTNAGSASINVTSFGALDLTASNGIFFQSGTQERFRITSSGTAVFGGNSAAPLIDNGELYYRGNSTSTFDNLPQNLYLYSDDIAYNGTNPGAGMVFGGSYHSNGSYTTFAGIHGIKENSTDNQYGGALIFGVRPNGANTPWERLRIDSSGNMALGTDSVGTTNGAIGLKFGMKSNNNNAITFETTNATTNRGLLIESRLTGRSGNETFAQMHMKQEVGGQGGYINFYTAPNGAATSERLRITSAGNLKMPDGAEIQLGNDTQTATGDLRLFHNGSNSGIINSQGALYIQNTATNSSDLHLQAKSSIQLHCPSDGDTRMLITNQGKIGMGAPSTYTDPYRLYLRYFWDAGANYANGLVIDSRPDVLVTKHIRFFYALHSSGGNSELGSVTSSNAGSVSYNTSSDYRRKQNDVAITDGIAKVKNLRPIRFNWIEQPEITEEGFFAHEAQEVVPNSVFGAKDAVDKDGNPDYQVMDHSKLVPLLTASIKDLIAKVETLETEVATLKGS